MTDGSELHGEPLHAARVDRFRRLLRSSRKDSISSTPVASEDQARAIRRPDRSGCDDALRKPNGSVLPRARSVIQMSTALVLGSTSDAARRRLIGRQPEIRVVALRRANRVERVAHAVNAMLSDRCWAIGRAYAMVPVQRGRTRALMKERVAADVFGDEERLAFQLEALCVKRLAQQPVSIHKQQIPWRRIDWRSCRRRIRAFGLAIQRPGIHTTLIRLRPMIEQEVMAVGQKRWISMRVLLAGCIDDRHRRELFRPPRSHETMPCQFRCPEEDRVSVCPTWHRGSRLQVW